jgi:hypothetical protein
VSAVLAKWEALKDAQALYGVGSPEAKKAQAAYRRALTMSRKKREQQASA